MIAQQIPGITPLAPLAAIIPVAFIFGAAMLKELVEDIVGLIA
jgi:hypothetical protein